MYGVPEGLWCAVREDAGHVPTEQRRRKEGRVPSRDTGSAAALSKASVDPWLLAVLVLWNPDSWYI